jgi:hypothetical protein
MSTSVPSTVPTSSRGDDAAPSPLHPMPTRPSTSTRNATSRGKTEYAMGAEASLHCTLGPLDARTALRRPGARLNPTHLTRARDRRLAGSLGEHRHCSSVGVVALPSRQQRIRPLGAVGQPWRWSACIRFAHGRATGWSGSPGSLPSWGPQGSGRADFPRPALRDTASLRDADGGWLQERITLHEPSHGRPGETTLRAAM